MYLGEISGVSYKQRTVMLRLCVFAVAVGIVSASANYGRIVSGYDADIKDFPYQVSIHYYEVHKCGGSLVSNRHVITAAHCIVTYQNLRPEAITLHFGSANHDEGEKLHPETWFMYPNYDLSKNDCDVGFFVLEEPITYTPLIQPIQIAQRGERPKAGDMLTVAGWGRTSAESESLENSKTLKAIRIPALPEKLCRLITQYTPDMYTENQFCAGGGVNKSTISGDSGGGIVNKDKKLVGIVSWNKQYPPLTGYPSFFADVTSLKIHEFIDGVLGGVESF